MKALRKFVAAAVGVLSFLLPALPNATTLDADSLLALHAEALGGLGQIAAVRARYVESTIRMESTGLEGRIRSWTMRPCLARTEIDLGMLAIRRGYDGERLWTVDQNGKLAYREDPASLNDRVTDCLLESRDYLCAGSDTEREAAGLDTVDGVPCETLLLRPAGGSPCRLLISAESFLTVRAEIESPAGTVWMTFGDWREVDGVMFPFETVTEHVAIGQRLATRIEQIELNPSIDPALFFPPAEDARDYRFASGAGATIPFTYHLRHLYVPVELPGVAERPFFLLDSGAGMTVVDSVLAHAMALPEGGRIAGAGAGGMAEFRMTHLPGLGVAGIEFDEQTVIVYPANRLVGQLTGLPIGGVLGYDFLSRFAVVIDYENRFLAVSDPDSFHAPGGPAAVEAPLVNNIFSLPVRIDGAADGLFLLDTGANTTAVRRGFLETHGLLAGRRRASISITGAGGSSEAFLLRLGSVDIGETRLEEPVVAVTGEAEGVWALGGIDGVVGNDILERFTLILDYRDQQVTLVPNDQVGEPFHRDKSGIHASFDANGRWVVRWIVPGSPAAVSGLRPGDVILSVDGEPASREAVAGRIEDALSAEEGTTVEIRCSRNGRKMRASLRLSSYI